MEGKASSELCKGFEEEGRHTNKVLIIPDLSFELDFTAAYNIHNPGAKRDCNMESIVCLAKLEGLYVPAG